MAWEFEHDNLRYRSDEPGAAPEPESEEEASEEDTPWPSGPWFGEGKTSAEA